ncbi:alpha/beta hydrolase [Acinetobacter sp.]|uniref:alpha/beta hydrolase n=1 Tax=Acinetobacter sp. TaxID=472 RepID=UPI0035B10BD8
MHLKIAMALFGSSLMLNLSACQNTHSSTKVIAGVFNASTEIQKKFIDKHAPKDVLSQKNIQYLADPDLHFDLYQPQNIAALGARPTVVWIHGGGWVSGSKEHAGGYFKLLAAQGYNVIAVEYEFAPQFIYPAQLQQINQALSYIQAHAAQYHIDANKLYLAGDSAGANMASHYAAFVSNPEYAAAQDFQPVIKRNQLQGLILHCGIYDLQDFVETAPEEIGLLEWGINNLVQAYTGERKNDSAFLASISPRQHINQNFPPVLISGGNKDFLTASQSLPFVETLKTHHVPVVEAFYPDSKELLVHEYQFMMSKKASQQTFAMTLEFLHALTP